jgi:hypothetical protein
MINGLGFKCPQSARHQIGGLMCPPSGRWPWCVCKVVRLQGSGMVLYDLPAIRSVEMLKTRQKGPLTALFVLCLCLYASTPENGLSGVLGGFVPAIC